MSGIVTFEFETPIVVPPTPEDRGGQGNGVWSFIYRGEYVDRVKQYYGREKQKLCLKIFKNPIKNDIDTFYWSYHDRFDIPTPDKGSLLIEATKVQNIYAMNNMAPRVYDVILIKQEGKEYAAQLTDDMGVVEGSEGDWLEKLQVLADKYQLEIFRDGKSCNIVGDKWVDFQGFKFKEDYEEGLKKRIDGVAKWGPFSNYQPIDQLKLKGGRNNTHRIERMKLDTLDFERKTVLDIGCSAGVFCNYADDRGAKRVVGFELPEVARAAQELSNYLGYFNVDYYGVNLEGVNYPILANMAGVSKFDIVLFLSMGMHIGFPDYVNDFVGDILVFEGNSRDIDKQIEQDMKEKYEIQMQSVTEDLFVRPILIGKKK